MVLLCPHLHDQFLWHCVDTIVVTEWGLSLSEWISHQSLDDDGEAGWWQEASDCPRATYGPMWRVSQSHMGKCPTSAWVYIHQRLCFSASLGIEFLHSARWRTQFKVDTRYLIQEVFIEHLTCAYHCVWPWSRCKLRVCWQWRLWGPGVPIKKVVQEGWEARGRWVSGNLWKGGSGMGLWAWTLEPASLRFKAQLICLIAVWPWKGQLTPKPKANNLLEGRGQ